MALLEVSEISKHFGGSVALDSVSFDAFESEILGIIGPNGAGKTTLFNIISGFLRPTSGKVIFNGEDITGLRVDQIAHRGIGRTFQEPALFKQSTAFNNVFAAFHMSYKVGLWSAFLHIRSVREEERAIRQKAMEIMDFFALLPHRDKLAGNLSSGYQKALSLCIAFAMRPKLLLLDEPVTTLSPDKVEMIMELVTKVRGTGTTVVIIEHNMKAIMHYCDRIVVLAYGNKIAEGLPQEIRENKDVVEAYLGVTG
jgi:ABC-type branched-subunit amino acid transport system ATPase component